MCLPVKGLLLMSLLEGKLEKKEWMVEEESTSRDKQQLQRYWIPMFAKILPLALE